MDKVGIEIYLACFQVCLQQNLVAFGQLLKKAWALRFIKGNALCRQLFFQLSQNLAPVSPSLIHLVYENENRYPVAFEQFPKGSRMALYAVGAADDQNGIIQGMKGPFHLCGKIHVARRVEKSHLDTGVFKHSLLGKDGDSSQPFQFMGVQICISIINSAEAADPAA